MTTRGKDWTSTLLRVAPFIVVIALLVGYLAWRRSGDEPAREREPAGQVPPPSPVGGDGPATPPSDDDVAETEEAEAAVDEETTSGYTATEKRWLRTTGTPPVWPQRFRSGANCGDAVRRLRSLCQRLDREPDVQSMGLESGTFDLLTALARDLAADPPVVQGVLRNADRARANVAHLYRVFGKERTGKVIRILGGHPEYAEPLALAVYRWSSAEDCSDGSPTPIDLERQYEYAAFLVNTIGGQAYLRRRSPRQEALASFYALMIAWRAMERRHDPHGVNILPEIERCIELMQGADLVFRDRYIEQLEAMQRTFAPA